MGSLDTPRQDQMNQDRDPSQDQEETELGLQIRLQQRWVQPVAGPETNCLVWAPASTCDWRQDSPSDNPGTTEEIRPNRALPTQKPSQGLKNQG